MFFLFSHGFTLELYFVSVVNQAVKDSIGEAKAANHIMPFFGGQPQGASNALICKWGIFNRYMAPWGRTSSE